MELLHPSSADAGDARETDDVLARPSVVTALLRALDELQRGDTSTEDEVRAALLARGRIGRRRA